MSGLRRFIDIGANLTDPMYSGIYNGSKKHEPDLLNVLKRAWEGGMEKMIITGGNLAESKTALELAQTDERLYSTVGCHPTRCTEFESNGDPQTYLQNMKDVIENGKEKIVALGECGLDYDRVQFCPIETQKKYFQIQMDLNKDVKLPLFLHCRNAADDLFEILSHYKNFTGVVHSFDGTFEEANRFIDLGYYIGINGCSLKTKENLETVAKIPSSKLLIETDCPWCEVRPTHAGYNFIKSKNVYESVKKEKWKPDCMVKSRNEPVNIQQVLEILAEVKKENVNELCEKIYENTLKLFFLN